MLRFVRLVSSAHFTVETGKAMIDDFGLGHHRAASIALHTRTLERLVVPFHSFRLVVGWRYRASGFLRIKLTNDIMGVKGLQRILLKFIRPLLKNFKTV